MALLKNSNLAKLNFVLDYISFYNFSLNTPWEELDQEIKNLFFYGSKGKKIKFRYDDNGRIYELNRPFEGIIPNLERRSRENTSSWIRDEFERYKNERECASCNG